MRPSYCSFQLEGFEQAGCPEEGTLWGLGSLQQDSHHLFLMADREKPTLGLKP